MCYAGKVAQKKYYHEVLGFNSRLDTLQAAILNVKLNYLEQWNEGRRTVAYRYNDLLSDVPVVTPYESPDSHHVYHQYTIRSSRRDELAAHLKDHRVSTMIYYPIPLHRQQLYAEMAALRFPNAELAGKEVLSLPIFPELALRDQEVIADTIRSLFDGH